MTIEKTATVGQIASQIPHSTRIFEQYGIDYCCGGARSLNEACGAAGVLPQDVIAAIENDNAVDPETYKEHARLEQQALVEHIISTHHVFTRYELARLARLIEKVVSVHGMRHPELFQVQEIFLRLYDDLAPHLVKEENVLFPYIIEMAKALRSGSHWESPCFDTVQNPARMMSVEHETAGELLSLLRKVTSNYTVPADACISYQTLYRALADFESDLHQHIHLENNILFPRAIQMEARLHPGAPG